MEAIPLNTSGQGSNELESTGIELTLVGPEDFISAVASALGDRPADATVLSSETLEESTELRLDLGTVAAVVSLVSDGFFSGPIIPVIVRAIMAYRPTVIQAETITNTDRREIPSRLTEEDATKIVQAMLKELAKAL